MSSLYGGVIMGVVSAVPGLSLINCLCCAGVMLGGVAAVFFYKKELAPDMKPLESADGMKLGALAGVFGGVIGTILTIIIFKTIGNVGGEMMLGMMEFLRDKMPPESWDQMSEGMLSDELPAVNLAIGFVLDIIFGLIGGLIGYQIFKPKQQMMNVQPPQQT
jgi:uncharacterized membrane protein YeaQ/YmgE (transglycosylase-associated protein family)